MAGCGGPLTPGDGHDRGPARRPTRRHRRAFGLVMLLGSAVATAAEPGPGVPSSARSGSVGRPGGAASGADGTPGRRDQPGRPDDEGAGGEGAERPEEESKGGEAGRKDQ